VTEIVCTLCGELFAAIDTPFASDACTLEHIFPYPIINLAWTIQKMLCYMIVMIQKRSDAGDKKEADDALRAKLFISKNVFHGNKLSCCGQRRVRSR
jgi:hypothetical protein